MLTDIIESSPSLQEEPDILKSGNGSGPETGLNDDVKKIINDHKDKLPFLLQQVMHTCQSMIVACSWQGKMFNSTQCVPKLLDVRRTDAGYCCSFNTLKTAEQL